MQIKSNEEAREYRAKIFFGMTLRQLLCSALAAAGAFVPFLLLQGRVPVEVISWVCILTAAPFAAFGFIRWHGMYMEEIVRVFYRSRVVLGKTVYFRPANPGKALIIQYLKDKEREEIAAKRKKAEKKAS